MFSYIVSLKPLSLSLFSEVFSDRIHTVERRDNKAEQGKTRKDKIRQTRQDKRNERADVPQYKSSLCTGQYSRVGMDNDDVHDHSCRYGNSEGVLYTHVHTCGQTGRLRGVSATGVGQLAWYLPLAASASIISGRRNRPNSQNIDTTSNNNIIQLIAQNPPLVHPDLAPPHLMSTAVFLFPLYVLTAVPPFLLDKNRSCSWCCGRWR